MLLSWVKERSYKQRLVTRCDEIVRGGVRRLGENSVAPRFHCWRESAGICKGKNACVAHGAILSRAAPVAAVSRSPGVRRARHRVLPTRLPRRWTRLRTAAHAERYVIAVSRRWLKAQYWRA